MPKISAQPKTQKLVKIGDAANILGVSIDTLRRWEKKGKIQAIRTPGGTRLYNVKRLKNFLQEPQVPHISPVSPREAEIIERKEEAEINFQNETLESNNISEILDRVESAPLKETFQTTTTFYADPIDQKESSILEKINDSFSNTSDNISQYMQSVGHYLPNYRLFLSAFGFSFTVSALVTVLWLWTPQSVVQPLSSKDIQTTSKGAQIQQLGRLALDGLRGVLAASSSAGFLEINSDLHLNGSLNGLSIKSDNNSSLSVTNGDIALDQTLTASSSPTFSSLNLSSTQNQLIFQSSGPTGTLTWTPTAARIITLPDATTTLTGTDTTQTITNKTISGSSNTLTAIPNSALTNHKITISPGTNLTGGGDVELGSSITLSIKSSPAITGVLSLPDGTAAAPSLTFTDDTDTGLYRIGTNKIGLITGGVATQGITIDASGNLGVGTITPSSTLDITGTTNVTGNTTLGGTLGVTAATTLSSTLAVTGDTTLTGDLAVNGGDLTTTATTFNLVNATATTLNIGGAATSLSLGASTGTATINNATTVLAGVLNVNGTGNSYVNGNLGVGTSSPGAKLAVAGGATIGYTGTENAPTNGLAVFGNVGIGTTSPNYKLDVNGVSRTYDLITHDVALSGGNANTLTGFVGYSGYTNLSGGLGTGGSDSILNAQRITNTGNLVNIGSIRAGETLLSRAGTFATAATYTTGTTVKSVAMGDIDGDGRTDLVTTNYGSSTISVFINNGNGTFGTKVDYTASSGVYDVDIEDVNGDGKADIVTSNENSTISVFINNGNGTFASKVDYNVSGSTYALDIKDLNGDGKADIAAVDYATSIVSVFINNGNGTFASKVDYATGTNPIGVAIGDLNGDGKADLAVTSLADVVSVFINNGNGTFASKVDYATGTDSWGVAIGDVNGDNKADLAVVNHQSSNVSIFINNGNGTFATQVTYSVGTNPSAVAMGDVNGDGKADLAVTNQTGSTVSVLVNNGSGTFATQVTYSSASSTSVSGIAMGDINGDGKADLAVATNSTTVSVLLNTISAMFYAQASTGNVGIGTSSPTSKLSIVGGNMDLFGGNLGIGTSSPGARLAVAGGGLFGYTGTQSLSSGASLGVLGNVGIGTTSPTYNLQVVGTANVTSTLTASNGLTLTTGALNLTSTSGTVGLTLSSSQTAFNIQSGLFDIDTASSRVGIGTATPQNKLDVSGAVAIGSYAGDKTAPSNGLIVSGNVGIGTSSPQTALHVMGRTTVGGHILPSGASIDIGSSAVRFSTGYFDTIDANNLSGAVSTSGTDNPSWTINQNNVSADTEDMSLSFERGSSSPNAVLGWDTTNKEFTLNGGLHLTDTITPTGYQTLLNLSYGGTGAAFRINDDGTSADSTPFLIDTNGNVGIGTSAPGSSLQINGNGVIGFGGAPFTAPSQGLVVSGNTGIGTSNPSQQFQVNPSGSAAFVITSSGNVGIGTTSPTAKIDVSNAFYADSGIIYVRPQTGTVGGEIDFLTPNAALYNTAYIYNDSGAMRFVSGTPSSGDKTLRWTGSTTTLDLVGSGSSLSGTIEGFKTLLSSDNTITLDSGTANKVTIGASDNFIVPSGNIGIGTSSPGAKLAVAGGGLFGYTGTQVAPTNGLAVLGNVGIGTTSPNYKLEVVGTTNITGALTVGGATTLSSTLSLADGSAATPALNFTNDTDSGLWRIGTNSIGLTVAGDVNKGLSINSNGNVGIGTTNPTSNLHISSTSTTATGFSVQTDNAFVANPSSSSDTEFVGQRITLETGSGNVALGGNLDSFGNLMGVYSIARNSGTGTVGSVAGVLGSGQNNSTGTVTSAYGTVGRVANWSGSGTITNAYGLYSYVWANNGTIANRYGLYVANSSTGASSTNNYGGYIAAQTAATNNVGLLIDEATGTKNTNLLIGTTTIPTGSYSIFNASTDANYFRGNLGIGTSSPGAKLAVAGGGLFGYTGTQNLSLGSSLAVSGNVGIGTTSPNYTLEVVGTTNITGNTTIGGTSGLNLSGVGGDITFANGEKIDNDTNGVIALSDGSTNMGLFKRPSSDTTKTGLYVNNTLFVGDTEGGSGDGLDNRRYTIYTNRTWTGALVNAAAIRIDDSITAGANLGIYTLRSNPLWATSTSGTHALFTNGYFESPTITNNGATVTDATSLYILNAPGGVTTNPTTAMWVDSGNVRFDGNLGVGYASSNIGSALVVNGNVGIGTSTPGSKLQVNGGGVIGFGGAPFAAPSNGLVVGGNVGIGTSSPIAKLHVEGQCVTGDTKLKRRRRRKGKNGEWIEDFEDVRIDEIQPGDEILTLDEQTGKFVPQKVEGLMDMGIQKTFRLITRSGLTIETTSNHPYLVKTKNNKPEITKVAGTFEVDQSNRIENSNKNTYISIADKKTNATVVITKHIKKLLYNKFIQNLPAVDQQTKLKSFAPDLFARSIVSIVISMKTQPSHLIIDLEYPGYQELISRIIYTSIKNITLEFRSIGKSSPAHLAAYSFGGKRLGQKNKTVEPFEGTIALLHPEFTGIRNAHGLFPSLYHKEQNLSSNTEWIKVAQLKPGMVIATTKGWEPIRAIYATGNKHTYDIQVANTHNFVGNGIVAHNTYISGNMGIGSSNPGASLQIGGNATIGYGEGTATQAQALAVAGNLGVGTSSPNYKLEVVGNTNIAGNLTVTGSQTFSGQLQLADGSNAAPSLTFANDTDTGLWRIGTNSLALTTGGGINNGLSINSNGNVGIGTTGPTSLFSVGNNALQIDSSGHIAIGIVPDSNTIKTYGSGAQKIALETSTTTAGSESSILLTGPAGLSIIGSAQSAGAILNGSVAGELILGNRSGKSIILSADSSFTREDLVINSSGNVGIGTSTPGSKLQVNGSGVIGFGGAPFAAPSQGLVVSGNVGIGTSAPANKLDVNGAAVIGTFAGSTGPTNGLAVSGNVGIGVTSTSANLHVLANASTGTGVLFDNNQLSTGNQFLLQSTSTAFSSGNLASIDWTPGSSTTATGDLFRINIGSNGNAGNLLNILDSGSSIFSVSETAVTTSLPVNFTSPGDVSIAYDINFTNPTASYIKSAAPLVIAAGKVYNSSNLTLQTYNSGQLVLDAAGGVSLNQQQNWNLATGTNSLNFLTPSGSTIMGLDATNGNVGIGVTAASTAKFVIQGAGTTTGIAFMTQDSSGSKKTAILDNGNLGVGTTSPTTALEVIGTATISSDLAVNGGDITTNQTTFNLVNGTATTVNFAGAATSLTVGATTGTGYYRNATSTFLGNLGIGTSSPGARLAVAGSGLFGYTGTQNLSSGTDLAVLGNVGVGTTSPNYNLEVVGTTNITGAATFGGALQLADGSNSSPALAFTNDTDTGLYRIDANRLSLVTAGASALTINSTGNVGVGTTSPIAKLHVEGQCVTGDTKLKRRRRRKGKNGEWIDTWEDIEIKDIQEGDEILSLNTKTGVFEPHIVRGLMEMGTQEVFELLTESGKSIQTTANHPYFADTTDTKAINLNVIQKQTFEYSEKLAKAFYVNHLAGRKVKSKALNDTVVFTHTGWNHFVEKSRSLNELMTRFFALSRTTILIKKGNKVGYRKVKKTDMIIEYWELQAVVENILISVLVCAIDKGPKFFLTCNWLGTKTKVGIKANKKELSLAPNAAFAGSDRRRELVIPQLFSKLTLPQVSESVKWIKVQDLHVGQKIATFDGWEKIVSIKKVGRKETYDIEIDQTRNFVGNDIVAHNTYIHGNLGIGSSNPGASLQIGGNATIGYGEGTVTQAQALAVAGNLGVGTSSPNYKLEVVGTSNITGAATFGSTGSFASTLTASNGLTLTTGALNLTSTSGTASLTLSSSTTAFNVQSGLFDIDTTNSRVGIGTATPKNKLDVSGAIAIGTYAGATAAPSNGLIISGNMGVGTSAPTAPFEVATTINSGINNINVSDTALQRPIYSSQRARGTLTSPSAVQNGDNLSTFITSGYSPNGAYAAVADINVSVDAAPSGSSVPSRMVFTTTTIGDTARSAKMTIDNSGNVGIGNSSPNFKLQVVGTTNITGNTTIGGNLTVAGSQTFSGQLQLADGTNAAPSLAFTNDTNTGLYRIDSDRMSLVTGGASRLTINANGNVGIGTSSPDSALEITGNLLFTKEATRTISVGASTTTNTAGGALTVTGGAGAGTGAGGAITITGGASGAGATGNGGALNLRSGAATSTAGTGGTIALLTGVGTTSGASGAITLTTATGGSSGNSGGITLLTGAPGGSTADSGNILIQTGDPINNSNSTGGNISLLAGGNTVSGNINGGGGSLILTAGQGGPNSSPGAVTITGGAFDQGNGGGGVTAGAVNIVGGANSTNGSGTNGAGGAVNITGGLGLAASAGGAVVLTGGRGGATGTGAAITLTTGAGGTTSGASGAITIASGTSTAGSGSNSGAITIQSATAATHTTGTGGTSGAIILRSQNGGAATTGNGGASGALTISTGTGGAVSTSTGTGGAAGTLSITGGTGGGSNAVTGGAGANINITAGNGGTGSTTGGAAGNITLVGGNAGSGGNVNGGNIILLPGSATGSGTAGNVGIGTSTPTNKLSILGTADLFGGNLGIGTSSPGAGLAVAGGATIGYTGTETAPTNGLAVSGNVGIGVTSTSANLHVLANASTGTGVLFDNIALSTGNMFKLQSTSTSFSSGNLMNIDWTPGAATTATGDLFRINIGANGTAGNLLNILDGGSSIFSVSETAVTTSLPVNFTSPGDVSIAYDLNFTNPTASYIKSAAPLYIQAGPSYGSNDITLQTFNSGGLVFDLPGGASFSQTQNWTITNSTVALNFLTSGGSTIMGLDGTNGNVGIGATNISAKLEVRGGGTSREITLLTTGSTRTVGLAVLDNGNVGIGTSAPRTKLDVIGNGTYAASFMSGNVGVGTSTPTAPFEVKAAGTGTIAKFTSDNTTGCTLADGGTISCSSDQTLKKNIGDLPYGLDDLMNLRPVEFNWKTESDSTVKSLGFIAQEVESVIPKLVRTDTNGLKELNTIGLVPVLIQAIQQQQLQIASNSAQLASQSAAIVSQGEALSTQGLALTGLALAQTNLATNLTTQQISLGDITIASTSGKLNIAFAGQNVMQVDNAGNLTLAGTIASQASGFDVAESYPTDDQTIEAGDVVSIGESVKGQGESDGKIVKSSTPYDRKVIGIITTKPGLTLTSKSVDGKDVALAGRVPVKVTTENGEIKAGDSLTTSSIPGYAMKATQPGTVIGKAFESFSCSSLVVSLSSSDQRLATNDQICQGKIMTFINVSWYDPTIYFAKDGNLTITNHESGIMNQESLLTQESASQSAVASPSATVNHELITNNLQQDTTIKDLLAKYDSLASRLDTLQSVVIGPSDALGASTSSATATDSATISADGIASASAFLNTIYDIQNTSTSSAELLAAIDGASINASGSATITGTLTVSGRTTLNDLGVTGTISAGMLAIDGFEGSINTLSGDLKLQSLALGGVDILNGKVVIDTKGNITTVATVTAKDVKAENIEAEKVTTNKLVISEPIATESAVLSASISATPTASPSAAPILASSVGTATIKAGKTTIEVKTSAITDGSLVFVTADQPIATSGKVQNDNTILISIPKPTPKDIKVNWWIVDTK